MEAKTKEIFFSIHSKFLNNEHTLADIANLIENIRYNKHSISDDATKILLQIPLCVLENQVEIKNTVSWAEQNGHYFAGNYAQEPFHSRFESKNFDLNIMVQCLYDIMTDPSKLNSDYHLRNPEATLRDFVTIKEHTNFKESGNYFACLMEKAFDC